MPRPYASAVIPASVDAVWDLVRDYNGLGGWWGEYDSQAAEESELDEFFAGAVYGAGLAALQERFG